MKNIKLCVLAAMGALALTTAPTQAALITDPESGLVLDTDPLVSYQQTAASPCVIGGNNCQNPVGFGFTDAAGGGSGTTSAYVSPTYTLAQITAAIGGTGFIVGLDYNDTAVPQNLIYFEARYIAGGVQLSTQRFDVSPAVVLPTNNNGVGYSDFLLSGFALPGGADSIQFAASWFNNDGPDRFFLINSGDTPDPVAEPTTLALLGFGLLGASFARRRRQ